MPRYNTPNGPALAVAIIGAIFTVVLSIGLPVLVVFALLRYLGAC